MYGEQTGEVVQTTATATAAECCTACKGSTQCNTWNYCYCNRGCGNNPKGTCLLKNQTNPFYPRCCWALLHQFLKRLSAWQTSCLVDELDIHCA